ncbi:MAG: hypothetical protein PV358_16875 [Acidimicrobiales bacterium]|nr:hypothetical protein [Acidimicrobiales bacterium]
MDDLLTAVRRRLRVTWTAATLQWLAPAVALAALGLVLVGRLRPWAWPEPAALVVAVVVVVGVVIGAALVRIPDLVAARAADRGLHTRDALAAALEVGDEPGPFTARVQARATEAAAGASARQAVPMPRALRRMASSSVLAAGALGLAWMPNPQDDVRRERAAEQAALAEALRTLADDLDGAGSLEEGLEALAQAGAIGLLSLDRYAGSLPLFGGVEGVRWRRQVRPGDEMTLTVDLEKLSSRGGWGAATATVGGKACCHARLFFVIAPAP